VMPQVWTDGVPRTMSYADIRYFNDSKGSNVDTSVLALDLTSSVPPTVESFLTRGGYQLYMSPENLYIAGVEWDYGPRTGAPQRVWAESTTVHKVSVSGSDVHYLCSVRVPGTILNQFSMDESSGYLRVATTLGQWTDVGRDTSAAVFVFDGSLNPTGSVTGIAPGERVFAARFLGDRAYLVTFHQVDPLFVLDVSDPTAPRVLGFLVMPGVSDYLHPYDATHLIGVGMSGTASGHLHGLKLSLYDVADVAHPSEVATYTIGGTDPSEWAYSEALYDHKAFLFIPARNLTVLPVSLSRYDGVTATWWEGAVALSVTPQAGFALKGTVTHEDFGTPPGPVRGDESVRRALYIGDTLYTVSNGLVLGNNLDTFAEVARVPL
jgi:inhibitor of cysteine peptidase